MIPWLILTLIVLTWEVTGVKTLCRLAHIPHTHPSLSEEVWKLHLWTRILIVCFLADVSVHFLFHTPLIPGIG